MDKVTTGSSTLFGQSMVKQTKKEERKDKNLREAEKIIRKKFRALPIGTELYVLRNSQLYNGTYLPGTKLKKISNLGRGHFIHCILPDGFKTEVHYRQIGTDDIQVTRKLLGL